MFCTTLDIAQQYGRLLKSGPAFYVTIKPYYSLMKSQQLFLILMNVAKNAHMYFCLIPFHADRSL